MYIFKCKIHSPIDQRAAQNVRSTKLLFRKRVPFIVVGCTKIGFPAMAFHSKKYRTWRAEISCNDSINIAGSKKKRIYFRRLFSFRRYSGSRVKDEPIKSKSFNFMT